MKLIHVIALIIPIILFLPSLAYTDDIIVSAIEVLDNSAQMYRTRDLIVTCETGPCKGELPKKIRIGDVLTAGDCSVVVRLIIVTHHEKTLKWMGKILVRKGDATANVVESRLNLPSEECTNRIWVHVKNCRIIN